MSRCGRVRKSATHDTEAIGDVTKTARTVCAASKKNITERRAM